MSIDLIMLLFSTACGGLLCGAFIGFRIKRHIRLETRHERLLKLMVSMESQLKGLRESVRNSQADQNIESFRKDYERAMGRCI